MALPKGYHYVSGTGRRSVSTPSGSRISRQAAENIFARSHGFSSEYARKQAAQSSGYKAFRSNTKGYNTGWKGAKASGTSQADFNAAAAKYYSDPANKSDKSPDGPLAKFLEAMGRRNPGDDWRVGESP